MLDGTSIQLPTVAPSNVDLERALLALIVADNAVMGRIGDLAEDDFFDDVNRQIFETARGLYADGRAINLITLKSNLYALRFADGRDLVSYLKEVSLAGEMPDAESASKLLRELAMRRRIMHAADAMTEMATNYKAPIPAIISESVRALDDIAARTKPAGRTKWTMQEATDDVLDKLADGEVPEMISTGLADLDRMTGCLRRGQYGILAGRPSMGKSAFAVCYALGAARKGHGVLFFSLEMSASQIAARAITEMAYRTDMRVEYASMMQGAVGLETIEGLVRRSKPLRNLPLTIDEEGSLTISEIAIRTRRHAIEMQKQGKQLDLVIVDHIGKVTPSNRYRGNKVQEMGEISHGLFQIGKSERVGVLALSQLNRQVEQRENKRPGLSDLRESGNLEQDADMVLFAFRPAYYLERAREDENTQQEMERIDRLEKCANLLEIGVAKNRNGKTGTCELFCDMGSNYVGNKERSNG